MNGKQIDAQYDPARRSTHGIAYVTEDRKTYGLILIDDIKHNITLANLPGVAERGVIDEPRGAEVANDYRAKLQHPLVERLPEDASICRAATSRRWC